jgi:hypothetical protein
MVNAGVLAANPWEEASGLDPEAVHTEHPGEDFILAEGPLASWSVEEDDEGPPGIE